MLFLKAMITCHHYLHSVFNLFALAACRSGTCKVHAAQALGLINDG